MSRRPSLEVRNSFRAFEYRLTLRVAFISGLQLVALVLTMPGLLWVNVHAVGEP